MVMGQWEDLLWSTRTALRTWTAHCILTSSEHASSVVKVNCLHLLQSSRLCVNGTYRAMLIYRTS